MTHSRFHFRDRLLWQITAVAFLFLGLRLLIFHRLFYIFLVWNLFLAVVPLWLSQGFELLLADRRRRGRVALAVIVGFLWLLFWPNAPYLVTDLIYLQYSSRFSLALDGAMLGTFALLGFLLGIYSLEIMKRSLARVWGKMLTWIFMVIVSILCGFAIYLGRFLRWNSWDLFTNPAGLWTSVVRLFSNAWPVQLAAMMRTTLAFAVAVIFFSLLFGHLVEIREHQK